MNTEKMICSACDSGNRQKYVHPLLGVPMCTKCYQLYNSGDFVQDDGNDIHCRWCGEGQGQLFLCDTCEKSFCEGCIGRNFGDVELVRISDCNTVWSCFLCNPTSLNELKELKGWNLIARRENSSQGKKSEKENSFIIDPDISKGREVFAIPCFNDQDKELPPNNFRYVNKFFPGENVSMNTNPSFLTCCNCLDNCINSNTCSCMALMNGRAYDEKGMLVSTKSAGIYECNQLCSCHKSICKNRVVGRGPQLKLQVFRCKNQLKGWGVRCLEDIPAGNTINLLL